MMVMTMMFLGVSDHLRDLLCLWPLPLAACATTHRIIIMIMMVMIIMMVVMIIIIMMMIVMIIVMLMIMITIVMIM